MNTQAKCRHFFLALALGTSGLLLSIPEANAWHNGHGYYHHGGYHGGYYRNAGWGGRGYYGGYNGWGYGGYYGGWGPSVVVAPYYYKTVNCKWIRGHYNHYGRWVRSHRACW